MHDSVIEIRLADPGDAPAISELAVEVQALHAAAHPAIFKPAGPATLPTEVIREQMMAHAHRWWVAVRDGDIAGYAHVVVQVEPETAWRYATTAVTLDAMSVASRHRRFGVGSALVAAAREAAAALGAAELRLNVWAFNEGARVFYRRCGFVPMQERLWLPISSSATTRSTQRIHAPVDRVFRALLDPELIPQWRVPAGMRCHVHEFEPHTGGHFRVSLTYDAPGESGKSSAHTDTYHGHFVEIEPNTRIVEVLEFETSDPALQGEMRITTTLTAVGGATELQSVHEGLPSGVAPADNEEGWRQSLAKLAVLLGSPGMQ